VATEKVVEEAKKTVEEKDKVIKEFGEKLVKLKGITEAVTEPEVIKIDV
jgi:hypothetical protein